MLCTMHCRSLPALSTPYTQLSPHQHRTNANQSPAILYQAVASIRAALPPLIARSFASSSIAAGHSHAHSPHNFTGNHSRLMMLTPQAPSVCMPTRVQH
jgi:hypothetical protein